MNEDEYPDWAPRGTCPFCESGQVYHQVLGMPTVDMVESAPPWVSFGCVVVGHDRLCGHCGETWTRGVEDGHWVHDVEGLLGYFLADSLDELSEILMNSFDYATEPWFDEENAAEGMIIPVLETRGVELEFPMTVEQFLQELEILEDELLERWEEEEAAEESEEDAV